MLLSTIDSDSNECDALKPVHKFPLTLTPADALDTGSYSLRSTKGHRGTLFAEVEGAMQVVSLAANLVKVKATRVGLKRPTVSADGQTIVVVWQLEETANTAELGSTERALPPPLQLLQSRSSLQTETES